MKRLFWTLVLAVMTTSAGWAAYVGAQELEGMMATVPALQDSGHRYQFMEHVFQQNGRDYEVFLRLDRQTGTAWRFHASQSRWQLVAEAEDGNVPIESKQNRYELMSHLYRDQAGKQRELILRVDFVEGLSWRCEGMSSRWQEITTEAKPEKSLAAQDAIDDSLQK